MPPTMPIAIAPIVPMMVPFTRPSSTGVWFMIWRATGKFHFSLVTNELIIIATRITMTTRATHRHGWGTGRALIRPGRSTPPRTAVSVSVVTGPASRVQREVGDPAGLDAVLLECRVVAAV